MKQQSSSRLMNSSTIVTILLIGVVASLVALPLLLNSNSKFGGADSAAEDAITEINPEAKPWFEPVWAPPEGEMQTLFFSVQAALGAGVVGYCLGLMKGRKRPKD